MNFEFVVVIPAYRFAQMDATVVRVHFPTFQVAKHENSSLCAFLVAFMLLCDFFHDNLVYGLMPSNNSRALGIAPDFTRDSVQAMKFVVPY